MLNSKNQNKGQILVVTLIIMFILSLLVLSTSINISRDTTERVFNEIYEENYFFSESRIIQASELLDAVATESNPITTLESGFKPLKGNLSSQIDVDCTVVQNDSYVCNIQEDCILTDLTYSLDNEIEDFEISSSEALQISLDGAGIGYDDFINVDWDGQAIWSIGLIYERSYGGQTYYELVKDLYDGLNQTSKTIDRFPFSNQTTNSFRIDSLNPSNINDPLIKSNFGKLVSLRLRPIIISGDTISVDVSGTSGLPNQFVDILSQSQNTCLDQASPSPLLSIKAPLSPAPPAFFDYVYLEG